MAKETQYIANETYYMAKETYYMTKKTYYMAKETYHAFVMGDRVRACACLCHMFIRIYDFMSYVYQNIYAFIRDECIIVLLLYYYVICLSEYICIYQG